MKNKEQNSHVLEISATKGIFGAISKIPVFSAGKELMTDFPTPGVPANT